MDEAPVADAGATAQKRISWVVGMWVADTCETHPAGHGRFVFFTVCRLCPESYESKVKSQRKWSSQRETLGVCEDSESVCVFADLGRMKSILGAHRQKRKEKEKKERGRGNNRTGYGSKKAILSRTFAHLC